jgi:hypothetical protein
MKPRVTLRKALQDRNLLGRSLPGPSWSAWRTILIAAMGEPLTDDERPVFTALTGGREHEPLHRCEEFAAVVGRRGGKTEATATTGAYIAGCCDFVADPAVVEIEQWHFGASESAEFQAHQRTHAHRVHWR